MGVQGAELPAPGSTQHRAGLFLGDFGCRRPGGFSCSSTDSWTAMFFHCMSAESLAPATDEARFGQDLSQKF